MKETKAQIMEGVENVLTSRVVANNTVEYTNLDGEIRIRLHHTDVVIFNPDGSVTYDSGGWRTVTTKDRMQNFGKHRVFSHQGIWFVSVDGEDVPFEDGITIHADGTVDGAGEDPKEKRKQLKRIKRYVKGYMDALANGDVPAPSEGDCWYCLMTTTEGQGLGEATRDTSHLENHFEEKYFVPSLLIRAIKTIPVSRAAESWLGWKWGHHNHENSFFEDIARDQLSRSLHRYLKEQFGFSR